MHPDVTNQVFEKVTLADLEKVGTELMQALKGFTVFAFHGEMGSGKTTFIKAIGKVLQIHDAMSSPTFSIVNEYHSFKEKKIYHFDFYRIQSTNEAYDMGYEEYFYSDAYCFIEWPEKVSELLPKDYVIVTMDVQGEKRIITIES